MVATTDTKDINSINDGDSLAELGKQVLTISPIQLIENLKNGTWAYCRPELYIRKGDNKKSIEEKKRALIHLEDINEAKKTAYGVVEILESIAVEHVDGVTYIISGNTRIKALVQLFENKSFILAAGDGYLTVNIPEENFLDIPYREFDKPLTFEEAINYQTGTNDFTQRHSPYEISLIVQKTKEYLENSDRLKKLSSKKLAGEVSKELQTLFRTTKVNISYYLTAATKGTPLLHQYLANQNISLYSANILIRKCAKNKKVNNELIDASLNRLAQDAKAELKLRKYGSDTLTPDQENEIDNEFSIYTKAIDSLFQTNETTTRNTETQEQQSTGFTDTQTSEPVEDELIDTGYSKSDVTTSFKQRYQEISTLDIGKLSEKPEISKKLFDGMVEFIATASNYREDASVDEFNLIKKVFLTLFSECEQHINSIPEDDKGSNQINKLVKAIGKIASPLDAMNKPEEPTNEKVSDDTATSETIELPETDVTVVENETHTAKAVSDTPVKNEDMPW